MHIDPGRARSGWLRAGGLSCHNIVPSRVSMVFIVIVISSSFFPVLTYVVESRWGQLSSTNGLVITLDGLDGIVPT